ncbi:MAG: redoxin domain-containing protein [Anaerolineales bacterium]|nr:redoxin domain-containing protein [Anaerolineales bacterium]
MAQLRQDYDKFTEQETEILVVGPEDANAFFDYWQKNDLPFIGLPDPGHTVLKRYGQEVNLFKFGRMPAQVAIDKDGIARFVHYGHDMSDIPANEEMLDLLKTMNKEVYASH